MNTCDNETAEIDPGEIMLGGPTMHRLNDNLEKLLDLLSDLREMVAPLLGYRVKEEK